MSESWRSTLLSCAQASFSHKVTKPGKTKLQSRRKFKVISAVCPLSKHLRYQREEGRVRGGRILPVQPKVNLWRQGSENVKGEHISKLLVVSVEKLTDWENV